RVSPLDDLELVAIMQRRPRVTTSRSDFRIRREHVERRERTRSDLNAFRFCRNLTADVREQLRLELHDAFFSAEYFLFPVAQLRRGVPFSIRECLASLVLNRHARRIRFRDFNVVTKDTIETNAQIIDSAASAFSGFECGDDLFRVTTRRP